MAVASIGVAVGSDIGVIVGDDALFGRDADQP